MDVSQNDFIAHSFIYTITGHQHIRFERKNPDGSVVYDGTTEDEVLSVVLDRLTKIGGDAEAIAAIKTAISKLGA